MPAAAARARAQKLFMELYAGEIKHADQPRSRKALSRQFEDAAKAEPDDAARFMLFSEARDLNAAAGDLDMTCKTIDVFNRYFTIDPIQEKFDAAIAIAKVARLPADMAGMIVAMEETATAAVAAGQFNIATKLSEQAVTAARQMDYPRLPAVLSTRSQQIHEAQKWSLAAKEAAAVLDKKPADPDANLKLGRIHCFINGDWDRGLPELARGSDAQLKALAEIEMKNVTDPANQIVVADGWWTLSESQSSWAQPQLRIHAAKWYAKAQPALSGLAKAKAEKRISEPSDTVFAAVLHEAHFAWLSGAMRLMRNWTIQSGKWREFPAGTITGEGDSDLHFRQPLPINSMLSFRINVVRGMRPRIYFDGPDFFIGNEGFVKIIQAYGARRQEGKGLPYANDQIIRIAIKLRADTFEVLVDDHVIHGNYNKIAECKLRISAGDSWSPGIVQFSGFRIEPLDGE